MLLIVSIYLTACQNNPDELTIEQANEFAQEYFREEHNMNVSILRREYKRVSDKQYLNVITVSEHNIEYELVLDENNKPLSDNVSAVETINRIDTLLFLELFQPLGFKLHKYIVPKAVFSYSGRCYTVNFPVVSVDLPDKALIDEVFLLLEPLRNAGVDDFIIVINSPTFCLPSCEFEHGTNGIQLGAEFFSTDISKKSFEEKYLSLTDRVYWDRDRFNNLLSELSRMGYSNARFFVSRLVGGHTIEITLYCKPEYGITDEPAIALLDEIDENYFRIGDKKTVYRIEHKYS
jgi:hypothetical protein